MAAADYVKAVGLAVLLLALNLLIAFAAVFVYAQLVEPGQERDFYAAAAPGIARWTAPVAGAALFLLAGWFTARRRPDRNGAAFIGAAFVAYLLVDAAFGAMAGGVEQLMTVQMAISMAAALVGGLAGVALARRAEPKPA